MCWVKLGLKIRVGATSVFFLSADFPLGCRSLSRGTGEKENRSQIFLGASRSHAKLCRNPFPWRDARSLSVGTETPPCELVCRQRSTSMRKIVVRLRIKVVRDRVKVTEAFLTE